MCREGKTRATLNKLQVFRNHLRYLILKPNEEWTEEDIKVHIVSIIEIEFPIILEKINDDNYDPRTGNSQNLAKDLSLPKPE